MIAAVCGSIAGCSDDDFASLYPDPSKTGDASVEKLMTGVFYSALSYTKPTRDGVEYFNLTIYSRNAQTQGYQNSGYGFRIPNAPTMRWEAFYKTMAQYRTLENVYDNLATDDDRTNYEVFKLLSEVFIYHQLLEMVSLFGDVPFEEAGKLVIAGDTEKSTPKFDKADALITKMLDRLAEINTRLREMEAAGLPLLARSYLPNQDYICKGDLKAWQRFANSLRLRAALRVASNGSLTAKGQGVLKEMLETNPSNYLLVETNAQNIQLPVDNEAFNPQKDESGSNGIRDAYSADDGRNLVPSQLLIDKLQAFNDPRLEVMLSPNKNGEYRGMAHTDPSARQDREWRDGLYSKIDSATFGWSNGIPGVLMTAAEVWFIRAEAIANGWAGDGTAEEAFKQGVRESVDFYFYLNGQSTYQPPLPLPTSAEISTFADAAWAGIGSEYGDAKEAIATQKWLHFSMFMQLEAWNDLRRTGLPALVFQDVPDGKAYNVPVDRFMYPTSEKLYNGANYNATGANDNESVELHRKLFWAKEVGYFTTITQETE